MAAELAIIGPGRSRWAFAAGCAGVVATQTPVLRRVGYPLLMIGVLAATLGWTAPIGYAPLRWGLVGLVGTLVLVAWSGRRAGPLGPVGEGRAARGLRAGGYLLISALAVEAVVFMGRAHNPDDKARYGVPIFTVMFVGYLLGFLALTARRSTATTRTLVAGMVAGGAAAVGWTVAVVVAPPIPPDVTPAIMLIALGMGVAAAVANRRAGAQTGLLAAVCAGTVAALLILNVVGVLSAFGPSRLIPDLAPAALSRAEDVAQSRIELGDSYLWLVLFGWLIAVLQCVASLATRQREPLAGGGHSPARAEVILPFTRVGGLVGSGLEQLDQVAGGVGEQDLPPAGP
jgi:hypothetical protein